MQSSVGATSKPSYWIRLSRQNCVKQYITTLNKNGQRRKRDGWSSRMKVRQVGGWRSVAPTEPLQGGASNEIRQQPSHHHHHHNPRAAQISTEVHHKVKWWQWQTAHFTLWLNSFSGFWPGCHVARHRPGTPSEHHIHQFDLKPTTT